MTASDSNGSYRKLSFDQVSRLEQIVGVDYIVQPVGDLPKITIKPQSLIVSLKNKLEEDGFVLEDIRINGSAASVAVGGNKCQTYNDLDILFNFASEKEQDFIQDRTRHDKMRLCVLKCLEAELPQEFRSSNTNYERLADSYFQKYVLVQNNNNDLWSLVALRSAACRNIELKFVDSMKRKYEFSIDSFQIIISEYLNFVETTDDASSSMNCKFFPTVYAESVYGDYDLAVKHLELQQIATHNPEEIRGGGLLKYCYLKTCGYHEADPDSMAQLNKYMCSRFFIDFPDVEMQRIQLEKYLVNHFTGRDELKRSFLLHVLRTVHHHAFCLPMRERSRTIEMIDEMARRQTYLTNFYTSSIYGGIYAPAVHQPVYLVSKHPDYRGCGSYQGSRHYDPLCVALQAVYITTSPEAIP